MGSMVNGKFVPGQFANGRFMMPGWRDKSGKAVSGNNYVEGGKSRGMSQLEIDDAKRKRGNPSRTALESETLGGG